MTYVIGLNDGHLATACLLKDGEIVACVSEERFARIKNQAGFPRLAVKFLLRYAGISGSEIDRVVLTWRNPVLLSAYVEEGFYGTVTGGIATRAGSWYLENVCGHFPRFSRGYVFGRTVYQKLFGRRLNKKRYNLVAKQVGIRNDRVVAVDHHICHAFASYYSSGYRRGETLVFTLDGEGDDCCAMVSRFSDGEMEVISRTPNYRSIGMLYQSVTRYLGMKPLEHEYKVMGLAPYASPDATKKSYQVMKKLILLKDSLTFDSPILSMSYHQFLQRNLRGHRFDGIAGAVQKITEELIVEWVRNGIRETGISRIAVGGGVFLNVKANMLINGMSEVDEAYFMPSPGDDSTPIGAAFHGYRDIGGTDTKPLKELYLGPSYSDEEISRELASLGEKYSVERMDGTEGSVAELLASGEIVARFAERMEWGARALGNRSILADPSRLELVRTLNEAIKMRDFWMPFAPTILVERAEEYISAPKPIHAPYMILATRSTPEAQKNLRAAIHPYDLTLRPQVLEGGWNEPYRAIIKAFEDKTGIGGVLNTSFNLHGEPIVCTPADAVHTFVESGLMHMAIGNYMVSKNQNKL